MRVHAMLRINETERSGKFARTSKRRMTRLDRVEELQEQMRENEKENDAQLRLWELKVGHRLEREEERKQRETAREEAKIERKLEREEEKEEGKLKRAYAGRRCEKDRKEGRQAREQEREDMVNERAENSRKEHEHLFTLFQMMSK